MAWVAAHATDEPVAVLDLGGRNINGSPRRLFPSATAYRCLDVRPGLGVDIVADAGSWTPDSLYDVVLSTECLEHAANWRDIVGVAFSALRSGGRFIVTAAGPGRPVHSAVDGRLNRLQPGEHYANIGARELSDALLDAGFIGVEVEQSLDPCDVRGVGSKP